MNDSSDGFQLGLSKSTLRSLLAMLRREEVTRFDYADERFRLRIERQPNGSFKPTATATTHNEIIKQEPATNEAFVFVTSPFVGTFYCAPSPDAQPFVQVGQHIRRGQVLCIIEAMKLMNEIESEVTGELVEVLVENGKAVEFGQKLFKVKQAI